MAMRFAVLAIGLFLAPAAGAQDDLTDLVCQAKPTRLCVLEMATKASNAAAAVTSENLPFTRIVETASHADQLDLALSLADRLDMNDTIALSELVRAAARADRIADLAPLFGRLGSDEATFIHSIAPFYAASGREADLAALIARTKPAPPGELVTSWRVEGELRAGRGDAAADLLREVGDAERPMVVDLVAEALVYNEDAHLAHPLAPFMASNEAHQLGRKAKIAEATADLELARFLVEPLASLANEDRIYVQRDVAYALAVSGDWQKAVDLANGLEPRHVPLALVWIAELSREPQLFPLIEKAMAGIETDGAREAVIQRLIRALILCDLAPVAQSYIEASPGPHERTQRLTHAAVALGQAGRLSDAVGVARSIEDPRDRAWAIWEVAWKMKEPAP